MRLSALFFLAFACMFAGYGGREPVPAKTVELTGDDDTKFNITSFEAKPGQQITLILKSIGELPKEAMSHNWVLLEPGTNAARLVQTGEVHPETDYIAPEQGRHVIAKTKLLGPGESDRITFTTPYIASPYEYICTFPEHYARGMKGTMTVAP